MYICNHLQLRLVWILNDTKISNFCEDPFLNCQEPFNIDLCLWAPGILPLVTYGNKNKNFIIYCARTTIQIQMLSVQFIGQWLNFTPSCQDTIEIPCNFKSHEIQKFFQHSGHHLQLISLIFFFFQYIWWLWQYSTLNWGTTNETTQKNYKGCPVYK